MTNILLLVVFVLDKLAFVYKTVGYGMIAIYTFGAFYGKGKVDAETLSTLIDTPLVYWAVTVAIAEALHNLMGVLGVQAVSFKEIKKLTKV
ncbi:hypothetical protein FGG79_11720 [Bacillus sp. BHET2]|uniref:hypothetical protein n=1 Tax=Bacillus sp. BHET2 TaxID=2583818 RepID=UPI00110F0110|nr:hypothetical protein [Bacillus sp. BHET2]TMU85858.1 hypothetical protein FGG79_11720 [Bacillus sp. BHET2]